MSGAPADAAGREERLGAMIAAYIAATEAGQSPDRAEIHAAHPDLAGELAEFVAGSDALRRLAASGRATNGAGEIRRDDDATRPVALGDFGGYERIEEIGHGGMGVVYRARHRRLNRVLALKRLIAGRWASAADVRRFRAEAEMAAQLEHPNFVPVYEVGEHDGHRYFSLRLMEGGSLADHPDRYADNPRAAAALVADVARAVHHAHQRGLLHCDLEAVCLHCLEKTPERRYGSALALAEDLECDLRGEPTLARALSAWALAWRGARRRRKTVAALAVVLAAAGCLALGLARTNRLREARLAVVRREQEVRRRDLDARRVWYTAEIRRAARRLANGELAAAVGALGGALDGSRPDRGDPDFRSFDWWYLQGLTRWWRASWIGHDGRAVYRVEFAPDGRTRVTPGGDEIARVWEADTGRLRLTLRGHEGDVDWVSFAPDGKRLVTTGDDATVRIWSATDGDLMHILGRFTDQAVATLFTPDGRDVIAASRKGDVGRWDAADGQRKAALEQPEPRVGLRLLPSRRTGPSCWRRATASRSGMS